MPSESGTMDVAGCEQNGAGLAQKHFSICEYIYVYVTRCVRLPNPFRPGQPACLGIHIYTYTYTYIYIYITEDP